MTHSEKRAHWVKEGAIGLGGKLSKCQTVWIHIRTDVLLFLILVQIVCKVGVLYGLTNTCVGHPWDTLKTKMQAQAGYEKTGMFQTFVKTLKTQGPIGLYRGCIPPLWGSGIYRSTQFAVFEGVYTFLGMRSPIWHYEIPFTAGLQLRVLAAGSVASTARAIIETPLEFAKIRRQTQQTWQLRKVYTGFGVTWVRTMGLMCSYFILVDTGRRNFPEHFKRPILGPFLISGVSATLGWWIVWPFEYMKSQVQSGYLGKDIPVWKRMAIIIREKGFFSLYRGILPGTIRSFLANGTSMVVMTFAQRKVSQLGLRN